MTQLLSGDPAGERSEPLKGLAAVVPHQRAPEPGLSPEHFAGPPWQRSLARALVVLDLTVVAACSLTAFALHADAGRGPHWLLAVLFPVGFILMIAVSRGYEGRFLGVGGDEF